MYLKKKKNLFEYIEKLQNLSCSSPADGGEDILL
jgi:hypothetical protein